MCVCVCVWYDGRGLSKEPRERVFLPSALLDEVSNGEIRAAPTGQVCYACGENACALPLHTRREAARMKKEGKSNKKNEKPSEGAEESLVLSTEMGNRLMRRQRIHFFENSGNKTCGGRAETRQSVRTQNPPATKPIHYSSVRKMKRRSTLYCFTRMWGKSIPQTLSGILLYRRKREFWWRVVCCLGSKYNN